MKAIDANLLRDTLESRRQPYSCVSSHLADALRDRKPFSLLRIGDGESVILRYEQGHDDPDLEAHLRLWFGDQLPTRRQLARIRRQLNGACRKATVLGLPTQRQCELHPRYRTSFEALEQLLNPRSQPIITDAAVHRFLHLSGDLLNCLRKSPFLGLITCRSIVDEVVDCFQPRQLVLHIVPPEQSDNLGSRVAGSCSWFPDGWSHLANVVRPPLRGAPYLVGAGLMGKLICELIRQRGGIAIDIGSVFDGWDAVRSRAYFDRYPPESYRLTHQETLANYSGQERLNHLKSLLDQHEAAPTSFRIEN